MRLPTRRDPDAALDTTLLDRELIIESEGTGQPLTNLLGAGAGTGTASTGAADSGGTAGAGNGVEGAPDTPRVRFLAYDACRVAGRALCDEPLRTRLMALRREVLTPRYRLAKTNPSAFAGDPFTLEQKGFCGLAQLPHIFARVQPAEPGAIALTRRGSQVQSLYHPPRKKGYCGPVVQLVRMPACHAGGRGFESRPVRQITRLNVCFYRRFFVSGLLLSLIGTILGTRYLQLILS